MFFIFKLGILYDLKAVISV